MPELVAVSVCAYPSAQALRRVRGHSTLLALTLATDKGVFCARQAWQLFVCYETVKRDVACVNGCTTVSDVASTCESAASLPASLTSFGGGPVPGRCSP